MYMHSVKKQLSFTEVHLIVQKEKVSKVINVTQF